MYYAQGQDTCFISIRDTFIENNIPISVKVNGTYNSILWDNGSTSNATTYATPGLHWVTITQHDSNTNLILNGNFESGRTGFSSGYTVAYPGASSFGPLGLGCYEVYDNPSMGHRLFANCTDITPSPGMFMLVANGSNIPTDVWCQTITVLPNTNYIFSAWACNVLNDTNVAQLQFKINGTLVGSTFQTTELACDWKQFYTIWNSGSSTSATICIRNLNLTYVGNDYAIDDIYFSGVCVYTDTFFIASLNSDTACTLHIPNAFSPNYDGNNDVFRVFPSCLPTTYTIQIFNRWGEMVHTANNINDYWDGRYKEREQPLDVYVYKISCRFSDSSEKFFKGNITLIR